MFQISLQSEELPLAILIKQVSCQQLRLASFHLRMSLIPLKHWRTLSPPADSELTAHFFSTLKTACHFLPKQHRSGRAQDFINSFTAWPSRTPPLYYLPRTFQCHRLLFPDFQPETAPSHPVQGYTQQEERERKHKHSRSSDTFLKLQLDWRRGRFPAF